MENPRTKFYVDKTSFWTHGTGVLLVLATVFQFIACWGLWTDRLFVLTQILLPVASFLLFVLLLSLLGDKALWLTVIPFLGGVAFYGLQAWSEENRIVMVIGITYCVLATVLYFGTVFSLIHTKWLLVPLFAIPFAYRAFYRNVLILQNTAKPAAFAAGMREISLLCVLLAMTLLALGMRKRVRERKGKSQEPTPAGMNPAPATAPAPASAPAPAPAPAPIPAPAPAPEIPVSESTVPSANDETNGI